MDWHVQTLVFRKLTYWSAEAAFDRGLQITVCDRHLPKSAQIVIRNRVDNYKSLQVKWWK